MITLYRKPNCNFCDEIEEELKELVINFDIVNVEDYKNFPREITLPAIKDDDKMISDYENINKYMDDLKKFVELWRKYQVDACYIDDNEQTC